MFLTISMLLRVFCCLFPFAYFANVKVLNYESSCFIRDDKVLCKNDYTRFVMGNYDYRLQMINQNNDYKLGQ